MLVNVIAKSKFKCWNWS